MPLWGNQDTVNNVPYYANSSNSAAASLYGTVYGVSNTEMFDPDSLKVPHSGWVAVKPYTDQHGTQRYKVEVLVAMNSIEGDNSSDDSLFQANGAS